MEWEEILTIMDVCEGGKILGTILVELRDYVDVDMTNNLLRDYVGTRWPILTVKMSMY